MQNILMERLEKNNKAFGDVVQIIKLKIANASPATKSKVLVNMSEAQFVEHRLEIFFSEIEKAVVAGYALDGAKELAIKEVLSDLDEPNKDKSKGR